MIIVIIMMIIKDIVAIIIIKIMITKDPWNKQRMELPRW